MQIIQMKVATGQTFEHEGAFHGAGCVLTMTAKDADAAQQAGKARPYTPPVAATKPAPAPAQTPTPAPAPAPAATPAPSPAALTGCARDDAIVAAIRTLDPETFGADGKPNTREISDAAGFKVPAAERDAVWTLMQALEPDADSEPGDSDSGEPGEDPAQPDLPS